MLDLNRNLLAVMKVILINTSNAGKLEFNGGSYEGEILNGRAYGEGVFIKEGDFPGTWTGPFCNN